MSFIDKVPRALRVLVVIAILAILIWQFSLGTNYYYYSIGAAVLLTAGAIILIYKPFKSSGGSKSARKAGAAGSRSDHEKSPEGRSDSDDDSQNIEIAEDFTDTPPAARAQSGRSSGATGSALPMRANMQASQPPPKPTVAEVARKNLQSSRLSQADNRVPPKTAAAEMKNDFRKSSKPVTPEEPPSESGADVKAVLDEKTPLAKAAGTSSGTSFLGKIPRGLRVLVPMAVFGVLIWRLAAPTAYYYYAIGAAVLLTFGIIVLVYKPFKSSGASRASRAGSETISAGTNETLPDKIDIESDYTDTPSILRKQPVTSFREATGKPGKPAPSSGRDLRSTTREVWSAKQAAPSTPPAEQPAAADGALDTDKVAATAPENETAAPAIPLVEDETTLTEEDKNQLVNAVWYRCENPYCKYTSFLGVHHIVEEKDGGTNRLDNLIVLCPYCHDLAHRAEIPVEEMKDWICNRENRFKFKPDWKYY